VRQNYRDDREELDGINRTDKIKEAAAGSFVLSALLNLANPVNPVYSF
jgi:hypothetical protein